MKRFAVIGDPIAHTLSPLIHNYNFKLNGDNYSYEAIHILPEALLNIRDIAQKHALDGFNVTLPHKTAIIAHLDDISSAARDVGAVNTVAVVNGKFTGYNTDVSGYQNALQETFELQPQLNVLILGGGGAAKAVHRVHHYLGHHVTIAVRNLEKIRDFSSFPYKAVRLNEVDLKGYDIIINATPIGLAGEDVFKVLELSADISNNTIGIDLIYNTHTPFLNYFTHKMDGLGMLVHQAMDAYTIWTGGSGHPDKVKDMLAEKL